MIPAKGATYEATHPRTTCGGASSTKSTRPCAGCGRFRQEHHNGILLGLGQVSESFDLAELLSGDYSYLDTFIMRKFQEAGRGIQGDEQIKIMINPPMDFQLTKSNFYFALEGNQA